MLDFYYENSRLSARKPISAFRSSRCPSVLRRPRVVLNIK